MVEFDVQTVSIAIASASVVAGVIYYSLQIRHQIKARQTDLVSRLYSTIGSEAFVKAWDIIKKDRDNDFQSHETKYGLSAYMQVCSLFEEVGILLNRRLIDKDLVDELFSVPVSLAWQRMKDWIQEDRKLTNEPRTWEWFEYLYNEMKKIEKTSIERTNSL